MMDKYSLFQGSSVGGSPHVHLIEPGSMYGMGETSGLSKTASQEHLPEVMELVESIQPQPDRLYLLNSALGAGERVGFNLRGDWFGEEGLTRTPDGWDKIAVWDIDARRQAANEATKVAGWGKLAWGFPTFYNAHRFRHHANSDPNRAHGFILGAFWDPRMMRVILVSELIRKLCAQQGALHLFDRIAGGDFPDTSMGARVPFDVCATCGNTARNPSEYCKCVRKGAQHPYGMGKLLPDGRRCGVRNPFPRFFDDSYVFVGACRSAKTMANLTDQVRGEHPYSQSVYRFGAGATKAASAIARGPANLGESREFISSALRRTRKDREEAAKDSDSGSRLSALLTQVQPASTAEERELLKAISGTRPKKAGIKWADLLKKVPAPHGGQKVILEYNERRTPPLSKEQLRVLARNPAQGLSKAAELGVVLTPEEFQYTVLLSVAEKTAEALRDAGQVFAPAPIPLTGSPAFRCGPVTEDFGREVVAALQPSLPLRSWVPDAVTARVASPDKTAPDFKRATAVSYPASSELGELYNDYRGGLVASPPDWRYVSVERRGASDLKTEGKTAEFAQELSKVLLRLAHWPALPIG